MEDRIDTLIQLLNTIDLKLDAINDKLDNNEEDIRILTEKVEAMDTSYGSGFSIDRFEE